jgi:hypothetical protein
MARFLLLDSPPEDYSKREWFVLNGNGGVLFCFKVTDYN